MARVPVIAALILAMAVIAGCGKETDKDNTPAEASQSVVQEATPSTDEAQEAAAEVAEATESETMDAVESTEETKEENIEEIINNIDFSKYANAGECIQDLEQYDTLMIIVYNSGEGKKILLDGDSYMYEEADCFFLNRSSANSKLKTAYIKLDTGDIGAQVMEEFCAFPFNSYFENGLYTMVIVYNDGTQKEINIDFTFTQE